MEKLCSCCKRDLPLDCFGRDRTTKDGLRYGCKACLNAKQREHKRKNRKECNKQAARSVWQSNLKNLYGITVEQYEAMYKAQNGLCAICKRPEATNHKSGVQRRLSVDHNHTTGNVRGLICTHCNQGIGNLRECPVILNQAIQYLAMYAEAA